MASNRSIHRWTDLINEFKTSVLFDMERIKVVYTQHEVKAAATTTTITQIYTSFLLKGKSTFTTYSFCL